MRRTFSLRKLNNKTKCSENAAHSSEIKAKTEWCIPCEGKEINRESDEASSKGSLVQKVVYTSYIYTYTLL